MCGKDFLGCERKTMPLIAASLGAIVGVVWALFVVPR